MSTLEKNLYKNLRVRSPKTNTQPIIDKSYKGISTVSSETKNYRLRNIELIKQDIVNHFHIRMGEKLERPEFGTIIWDVLFEPLTDSLKEAITQNVNDIINFDPRVQAEEIVVDSFENGIQVYTTLTYLDYNITEQLRFTFDKENGLI
jgi:phage baseplate assembly protein W